MRKIIFAMSLVLLASCSVKTNEEKARELIEPEVKANLVKPESYEFGQMQLDSCFSDSQQNPAFYTFILEVAKLFDKYKSLVSDAESAESSMTIYAPSYGYQSAHDRLQQQRYKAEMEKARRKAADTKEQILQRYRDNKKLLMDYQSGKHEFIGWMAAFGYRAETAGGMKTMGECLFYLNKDLTEITHLFTDEDLLEILDANLDDLRYEFEDELKEIFEEK